MTYSVKEIFLTLQGEGRNAGRPSVFVRFAGCNYWSGRGEDRGRGERCSNWCDTDFINGTRMSGDEIIDVVEQSWTGEGRRMIVWTGGEPGLQLDTDLLHSASRLGFSSCVETNGSIALPDWPMWVTVSPKVKAQELKQRRGNELKLVFGIGLEPEQYESLDFRDFCLQPLSESNIRETASYCLRNTRWNLSLQQHKIIGIR